MTLRSKMVFVTGLIGCGLFIAEVIAAFFVQSISLLNVFFILLIFSLFVIVVSYRLLIKRIEKLSQEVTAVQSQNLSKIHETGDDEITDIATQMNAILQTTEGIKQPMLQKFAGTMKASDFFVYDDKNNTFSKFAHYDKFISLPNRVLFNEMLNKSISYAKRHKKVLAILLVDFTPTVGNALLNCHLDEDTIKKLSERLNQNLRNEDIISKLDGNEFIILLTDIKKPKFARSVAAKLLKSCSSDISIDDKKIDLKTTIGICVYPNDGFTLDQLIENTYQSLYKAKQKNESAYQFYSDDLDIEAREYIQFEADLQRAIKNKELTLYFQPKMLLKTSQIVGVEALIRWIHPTLGIVMPDKFLPMAEDTGFIIKIGEWALREACMTNKFWQDEGYEHISVSLNISPKQFYDPELPKMLYKILQETKLNPKYLELELSESTVMMGDLEKTEQILKSLRAIGVVISMDHFGTGYTSISHLKCFPITIVKIDQTYIKSIPNNETDTSIARAMIALGRHLGMQVVAEGVETAEQLQFLSAVQCDVVQGYFLSYPVPAFTVSEQFKKLAEKVMF